MDSPEFRATGKLEKWFRSLHPIRMDIVGDFAGRELFIIEGDSLLQVAFSDERIDMNEGLQVLHSVYVVERFLHNLKSRGCHFHIIFFNFHKNLCVPEHENRDTYYKYQLSRVCIIQHLRRYAGASSIKGTYSACDHISGGDEQTTGSRSTQTDPEFQVHEFQRPYSQEFHLYLKSIRPYFILTHDGSTLKHRDSSTLRRMSLQKGMFLGFMRHMMSINVTIGLIQEVDFQNSKVFTFIIPASELIAPGTLPASMFSQLYESLSQEFQTPEIEPRPTFEGGEIQASIPRANMKPTLDPSTTLHLQSLAMLTKQQVTISPMYIAAFVLHLVLKRFLSLSQRRISQIGSSGNLKQVFAQADAFMKSLGMCQLKLVNNSGYAHNLVSAISGIGSPTGLGLADHIDGRLFKYALKNFVSIQNMKFPSDILVYHASLMEALKSDSDLDISHFSLGHPSSSTVNYLNKRQMPHEETENDTTEVMYATLKVLPFSNPVFNKHLSCIKLAVDTQLSAEMPTLSPLEKALYETHWHSTRRLDDMRTQGDKLVRISQKPKWWQLKGDQIARSKMLRYAKNLAGGEINPELIIVKKVGGKVARIQASAAKNVEQSQSSKTTAKTNMVKGTHGQASKSEQIKAANTQRISMKSQAKAAASWKSFYREICMPCETKRGVIVALTGFITKSKEETVTIEARLFKCCLLFEVWKEEYCASKENRSRGYNLVALIFNETKQILASPKLSISIKDALDTIFTLLGFTPLTSPKSYPSSGKVAFILPPPIPPKSLVNTEAGRDLGLHDFQLRYCGPFMERNLEPADDPRVKFRPDAWQIKVLDALDEDKSVFVVAPTSAGKTFIAYYAMEKILRADNDGVLVYVAPTKALVNQIAAELQTRFEKKYKDTRTVWAIHTRDYRVNSPQKCQILVTVPHILQIMLLSPALASSWSPRVKRIILDEVHCIGQGEDGVVWEQILLLAPCPIIALSATVGNPVQFHKWLQITQSSIVRQQSGKSSSSEEIVHGVPVELIHHRHRYNDLRKFRYNTKVQHPSNFIDDGTLFGGLDKVPVGAHLGIPNLDDIPRFQFIHPIAALCESDDHLPDDLVLESRDCYTLWRAMVSVQNAKYPVPKDLEPTTRFSETINKVDVIQWEEALKCILRTWLRDRDSPMAKLLNLLRGSNKNFSTEDASEPKAKGKITPPHCLDTMQLLSDLHKVNALPALLFSYDRQICNHLCARLVNILQAGEDHFRQTDLEWKRKVEEKESFDKAKERVKVHKRVAADNLEDPRDTPDSASIEYFDPKEPIQEFTFADPFKCSKEEVEKELKELRRAEIPEVFTQALRRGIGVHHAGISRTLRECVERLFRKGFLRVVIATGTLSLGINMPCATVVFVTDSVYLTPLNFRQASGRAGRRGFDLLGNVVFHKIPVHRIHRLMNSHLPSLTGHFPTSTTLILRLFILLYGSGNSDHAVTSINALLSQNQISVGLEQTSFKEQVMHHVRFSIEYLRRTNLLDVSGIPINFANCIANLYYTEPGNFMLNSLLHAGVFHKICGRFSSPSLSVPESGSVNDDVNRGLMLVLAHLFGRKPFKKGADLEELLQCRSSSTVVLAELPMEASKVIRKHNQLTLEIFINYVKTFAEQHSSVTHDTLPFTGARPSPTPAPASIHLDSNLLPSSSARSCFVSLSGHSDKFASLDDLLTSCRSDILLESSGIPYIPVDGDIKLNAYLYDFFLHGSVVELEKANEISRSGVWFLLNDFSMVLATIVTCLKNLIIYGPDDDMRLADGEELGQGAGDVLEAKQDAKASDGEAVGTQGSSYPNRAQSTAWDCSESEFSDGDSDDSDDSTSYMGQRSGVSRERERLLKVLKGFAGLQKAFNEKFKAIWATKSDRDKRAVGKGKKRLPNPRI
ncbi:hypothetical protein EV426DRAFT_682724 [Tirmania nivea]|nr:hypothetical protein EV426DRAFT_682724 [Tirmania nivea]